jgi:hypothetical protein
LLTGFAVRSESPRGIEILLHSLQAATSLSPANRSEATCALDPADRILPGGFRDPEITLLKFPAGISNYFNPVIKIARAIL